MMDMSTGKRQYRNPIADYQDQILFFGLFIIGAVAIVTLKKLAFRQVVVTAFPMCLMILYAAVALITKQYRLREDRVGDNFYYLGFLYTLISLAYALYVYDPAGSSASDIVTSFGIAIGTTILGLAGRVFFNQMREDPVEYEREAHYSLAEASSALRSQLSDISIEMSVFRRKVIQISEEGITDISNSAKESMTENVKQFSSIANEVIERIRTAFTAFTDHSVRLNDIASRNVEALQALFERIERIEASPGLIAAKFDPVMQKFEEVAGEALRRNRAQASDIKRVRDIIEEAATASEALRGSIIASDSTAKQKLEDFVGGLGIAVVAAKNLTEALVSATNTLSEKINFAQAATAELEQGMTIQRQSISEIRSTIEGDLQTIRQHREAMATLVLESQESVRTLQGALVSLSRAIVEQLGER